MNMILHGIDAPNLVHTNTQAENLMDIQPKDWVDVVLANPTLWRQGTQGGSAELPHQDRRDGFSISAALYPHVESGWPGRCSH